MNARRGMLAVLALAAMAAAAPAAMADTVTLNPIKDNTLYEPIAQDGFADRSDGAGPTMFTGKVKDADADPGPGARPAVRRGVLEFDIGSSIPAGATIDSVQLTLYCDKVSQNTAFNVSLHHALAEWGQGTSNTGNSQQGRGEAPTTGDATWRHTFYPGQFWANPGGDYTLTASATRSVGGTGGYTWGSTSGMVQDVQLWLDSPAQNHGWLILGTESQTGTAKRFATRENATLANRPKLVIQYTPQMITGACCDGSSCSLTAPGACSLPGVYLGHGTTCSPNPCVVLQGACCASDGTCSVASAASCSAAGGSYAGDDTTCAETECSIVLAPFLDPLPLPPDATPIEGVAGGTATYEMRIEESKVQMHSGLPPTTVWGYNDGTTGPGFLGPVIEARSNEPVTVHWINDLRDVGTGALRTSHHLAVDTNCIMGAENTAKVVTHLHGGHVPAAVDGYPEHTFVPGDPPVTYVYPNLQQAGYLWYHDHALGVTRLNVIMGLAGLYFIRDAVEDALGLPAGEFEVPLVIQDRKFNPDGSFRYPATFEDHFFGDKILVNGRVWPYLDVKRGKYRFRIVNGSTSRVYALSLVPPSGVLTFTVIGTELGLLEAPVPGVGQLLVSPGERYDVVVNVAGASPGDEILLVNGAAAPFPNGTVDVTDVMQFRVLNQTGDTDALPATLRPVPQLDPGQAVETRDFVLKRGGDDGCGRQMWTINDHGWNHISEYPELGTVEIWRFINDSGISHPMHMHLVAFQVLDRDGFTKGPNGEILPDGSPQLPPGEERGWKDTAIVGPNEILRVIARFDDYKGKYAYHCHILEHEEHEMMRQFQTVSCGDGEVDPGEACDAGLANGAPDSCCSAGCVAVTDGTACDDGNPCTTDDTCQAGICTGEGPLDPPVEVGGALVVSHSAGLTTIEWSPTAGAVWFDVLRGALGEFPVGGGAGEWCLADDLPGTMMTDAIDPDPGSGFWYLVRGVNACGGGSYGYQSRDGAPSEERSSDTCP